MNSPFALPLTESERLAAAPKQPLTPREWAEKHLRITEGPLVGQHGTSTAWLPSTFPLQSTIMEAVGDSRWLRKFLMASPQCAGKTESAALPPLLHGVEHRTVSALYMASRLPLAISQWRKKILTAMLADPDCAALIHENPDYGGDKEERRFKNHTSIHFAGAESVGALSGFTCPIVIADDLQAYPKALPGFGHPADIAFARAGAYPEGERTLVGMGTAGTVDDYLWTNMASSAMFCPFVPCPECGTYQLLEFSRLVYPEDDPIGALDSTWMRCAGGCAHQIAFAELPAMLANHLWASCPPDEDWVCKPKPDGTTIDPVTADLYPNTRRATRVAGFWSSALYWPLGQTWGQRAAEWIECRGKPDQEKDFQQRVRNVPWREPDPDENALTVEDLASHQGELYCKGHAPAWVNVITMTVDVMDRYLYYIVRGWRREDGTSGLIDAGTMGVHGPKSTEAISDAERQARTAQAIRMALAELWKLEQTGWPGAGGQTLRAERVAIDGGHRPNEVGQFCQLRNAGLTMRKWEMIKGSNSTEPVPIWAKAPKRTKNGHLYREIGVNEAKHLVRELLAIPVGQPGYWHTYSDKSLKTYHNHLVSEHFVPKIRDGAQKNVWVKREGAGPNHWWDCEVYQIGLAIAVGVRLPSVALQASDQSNTSRAGTATASAAGTGGGWFSNRRRK